MTIDNVYINEVLSDGVDYFYTNNDCEVSHDETVLLETDKFDEVNQCMINIKNSSYTVMKDDKILLMFQISYNEDYDMSDSKAIELAKKEIEFES